MMFGIETDAVVVDRQLYEGARFGQGHGHVSGVRVLLHIFQCLLEEAVERQLGVGREPRLQRVAGQVARHACPFGELRGRVAQDRIRPEMLQGTGPRMKRDALYLGGGPAELRPQFHRLLFGRAVARRQLVRERLAVCPTRVGETLTDV